MFVLHTHYPPISSDPKGSVHQDVVQYVFPRMHVHHVRYLDGQDHSQQCVGYATGQQAINVESAYGHIVQNGVCLAVH